MNLEGKTAIVTGAGRGIGQVIALNLATAGADIACVDITEEAVQETVELVKKLSRKAIALGANVAVTEQVEAVVSKVVDEWGKIDILVNNAGITRDTLLIRMKDEDWDNVLNVNLRGAFLCMRAVSKVMMKQRNGRIVNMASIVGINGNAGQANYSASKAGMIGLTKSIARELGSRNITCNAVAPGFIETAMTAKLPEDLRNQVISNTPLGRLGSPDDVANAVLFFCSEESKFVTGQVLSVDGGLVF